MKVLFIHNSIPEYRIAFWKSLGKYCNLDICVTHPYLESEQYGFEFDISELNILTEKLVTINPCGYDIIVLPPADSIWDIIVSHRFIRKCRTAHTFTIFWTETWMPLFGTWSFKRSLKRTLKNCGQRYIARRVDRCVAAGSKAHEYLLNLGIDDNHIRTVIDSSELGKADIEKIIEIEQRIPAGVKVILYFGRLSVWKGTDILARSFARILEKHDDYYLLVCGDGECRKSFETALYDNCPESSFCFVGKVNPSERASYFAVSDVFVLPSRITDGQIEIWGLSVNESLEAGVPVVATTAVGAAYDILDDEVGMVVDQGDSEALAKAIIQVADRNTNDNLRCACQNRARIYSVENMAKGFYRVFQELEKVDYSI